MLISGLLSSIHLIVVLALWTLVAACVAYLGVALASVLAFRFPSPPKLAETGKVTVLRPLCGDESGLEDGLESLLSQAVDDRRFRFVFGVASSLDPALALAKAVAARHPQRRVQFVADAAVHGSNPKVSNLINMSAGGLDELIVVTDSDVVLSPGSLSAIVDGLAPTGVGAVTALFRGRPQIEGSFVQRLAALYLDGWFLPTALLHARIGPAEVCYGQLTAIRREILPGGSFHCIANVLADDTELGHLARRAGRSIAFAPHVVEVCVNDSTLKALFGHELRWARTIRALKPNGYVASIVMHPGPLPLLLTVVQPGLAGWLAVLLLLLMRWTLVWTTHARLGRASSLPMAGPLVLWVREQIYFAVWVCGFFGRKIRWRGRVLWVGPEATVEDTATASAAELQPGAASAAVNP